MPDKDELQFGVEKNEELENTQIATKLNQFYVLNVNDNNIFASKSWPVEAFFFFLIAVAGPIYHRNQSLTMSNHKVQTYYLTIELNL